MNTRSLNRRPQRGAALLLAMLIVTLVATLAAGMVWQQWRAIEVESAERARTQSAWLLGGALDWARLILREDARDGGGDALTEPWATGLAEIRLSTFLAADKDNTQDTGLDAFLSGDIVDANSRYNLRNLATDDEETAKRELLAFTRLCDALGLPAAVAQRIAEAMAVSSEAEDLVENSQKAQASAPIRPQRVAQLRWLGLDQPTIDRLAPYVTILPNTSKVNLNTASPEVLMSVMDGLDRSSAQRLVQQRAQLKKGFASVSDAAKALGDKFGNSANAWAKAADFRSDYFEVTGQLRYEDSVLREVSLVQRQGAEVRVLWRERLSK
ncbi:MAG TPA: type II secretion system minor pseudopilin GspK [Ideonella sp.]|uniref:type II secretion system minor pseudopilin GspK n=1 Tax=Ideonella sp. TaxID=1929293 RepID=UPI002CF8CCEC|nr:type II secretion system minor pseudopilin GspK [Ideonella sp.]HSI49759.1 type II secretion system minor pseudopilin GspK [Ideonella sp.]